MPYAMRDTTFCPKEDADFEREKYRKTCLRFFKLMCATSLGKLCASDHAMNAIDEMSALNRDLKKFFDENGAAYPYGRHWKRKPGGICNEIRRNALRDVDAVCGSFQKQLTAVFGYDAIRQKPSRKKQSRNTGRSSPSCPSLKKATGSR